MTASLFVDLALACLLVATLVYGVILNRRLGMLRADRDQFAAVISGLNEATVRAVAGMEGLKQAAATSGRSLQTVVDQARATVEDLTFLVERGEKAAERLETVTRAENVRPAALARPAPVPAAVPRREPAPAAAPPRREERPAQPDPRQELLKTLEGMR